MEVTDLKSQLRRDEGERLEVYLDQKGIPTAGVGHNLPAHGIDLPVGSSIAQEQSDEWLDQDIAQATLLLLQHVPWAADLDPAREGALLNMMFNMGWGDGQHGLSSFHHFLAAMQTGDFERATLVMLESNWAKPAPIGVGPRAQRLSRQVLLGQWT